MRVSYPLSLKVSVWLMLNLLLLAGLGIGFFVVQGGPGWDALVAGPSGDRIQALANVIAGEVSATNGAARTEVLKRFGTAYRAEFFLFSIDETSIAGSPLDMPADVRARMEFRPPWGGPGGRRGGGGGDGFRGPRMDFERKRDGGPGGPGGADRFMREGSDKEAGPIAAKREQPPMPGGGGSGIDGRVGRFVVRAGSPVAYWVGMRVSYFSSERGFPMPAKLLVRVNSMWGLMHLLNLQSWVLAGTGVLVLSILFWLPLMRSITRSIGQLTAATEQIAEGRFETRVQADRRDELGKLGESVNRMATRLDAHMTGQKRFLGDVAHELCSPLARLQMATGILADQAPPGMQETVSDVREEVQQMSALVNELLAFTKAGMQSREVVCAAVDLAPLAREVAAREDALGRVTLQVPDDLRVIAERDLLARAVGNLVRNAIRYAGKSGPIVVSAAREHGNVTIAVEDNGPGVPPADLDRLGEPFFRPELARTRETGGVGLGLAIVRSSIASCGGQVRFANRMPQGFRAEIRLTSA